LCRQRHAIDLDGRCGQWVPASAINGLHIAATNDAKVRDTCAAGMSAMATPVQRQGERATGVAIVAGPSVRLTDARIRQFGPDLVSVASELALSGQASSLLKSANLGTWGNRIDGTAPETRRRIIRR
jgi:hypothetical protein